MELEGYSKEDIALLEKHGADEYKRLLNKAKARMDHFNAEKFMLPKAFDSWRKFVAMRKLFKYYLNFVDNRSSFPKADLASAFSQWRRQG